MLTIGSLFSGIGGLELGLERAGLGPVLWQVEIDPFCRGVLARHWPDAERFIDVTQENLYEPCDLVCGGFPCQDVSSAGKGAGLSGARSGLWREFARVVDEVRPRFVVVENVASGKRRWLPHVRRELCDLGYRTRAVGLSAADVGAPHLRRRVFVVAHAERVQLREQLRRGGGKSREGRTFPTGDGEDGSAQSLELANDDRAGRYERPNGRQGAQGEGGRPAAGRREGGGGWAAEPDVGRVAHGVPDRVDRLRALGNAIVPQCAEVVGRMIVGMLQSRPGGENGLRFARSRS